MAPTSCFNVNYFVNSISYTVYFDTLYPILGLVLHLTNSFKSLTDRCLPDISQGILFPLGWLWHQLGY